MEYNSALIKVDWLAAWTALRVVGTVLVVFLQRWRKMCTILQPMGSKGRYQIKCPKPCWLIKSNETWTKYHIRTLLSQREIALTARNTLFAFIGAPTKFKNWPRPLFGPRTDQACHQKPNPSRETVPYNVTRCFIVQQKWSKMEDNSFRYPKHICIGGHKIVNL